MLVDLSEFVGGSAPVRMGLMSVGRYSCWFCCSVMFVGLSIDPRHVRWEIVFSGASRKVCGRV